MMTKTEQMKKKRAALWDFLRAKGRLWILCGGALAGILLILLGNAFQTRGETMKQQTATEDLAALSAYEENLEKQLKEICGAVSGVGQVEVFVHLESGSRLLYAADRNGDPSTVGAGTSEQALPATLLSPKVAGVAIVCRGGNDPAVQKKLIDLVSTALGIPSNRVSVAGN